MAILKVNLSGHQSEELEEQGFIFPGSLQVDPTDPGVDVKVLVWLDENIPARSGDHIVIAAPGLPILRDLVMAWCHGMTGQFPSTVYAIRQWDGTFSWRSPVDLQALRNECARAKRPGTIKL